MHEKYNERIIPGALKDDGTFLPAVVRVSAIAEEEGAPVHVWVVSRSRGVVGGDFAFNEAEPRFYTDETEAFEEAKELFQDALERARDAFRRWPAKRAPF